MIYHSPTEPAGIIAPLAAAAMTCSIDVECSSLPERYGCDFIWRGNHKWWGIQRKEISDFLRSLDDGRLTMEIAQMTNMVTMPMIVLEGRLQWANETLMTRGWGGTLTRRGLNKRLLSITAKGVSVFQCERKHNTANFIVDAYLWSQSATHETASTRPKGTPWGRATNHDFQVHLLTSLPGVGRKTAEAILRTLGRCPVQMNATVEELCQVPGISKKSATKLIRSLSTSAGSESEP